MVTIRKAEARDHAALGVLGASLMRMHHAFDAKRFLPPGNNPERGYGSFLASLVDAEDDCVLVAEEDDAVIGYVYASLEPMSWKELRGPAGFIHDIVVDEGARRSGVATKLVDAARDWLRNRGAPRVILWTAPQNEAARALFRHIGFRETMIEMTMEL